MQNWFENTAILLWAIIGTITGGLILAVAAALTIYEIVAFFSRFVPNNPNNDEESSK